MDKIREYRKKYKDQNRDKINEKRRENRRLLKEQNKKKI